MIDIKQNLLQIRNEIAQISEMSGRESKDVTLVAVSKTKSIELIEEAFHSGQRHFAENYAQEGVEKIHNWNAKHEHQDDPIIWHFIGSIQSNKCASIAQNFSWVHSLANFKHAKRLNEFRKVNQVPLNVCIQVQIEKEPQRNGLLLDELSDFLIATSNLQQLKIRGLMCVLPAGWVDDKADYGFKLVQKKFIDLKKQFPSFDTLSLGMSNDYAQALNAGSTMLRLGSAIFGQRK